jgi:hypothetical protein
MDGRRIEDRDRRVLRSYQKRYLGAAQDNTSGTLSRQTSDDRYEPVAGFIEQLAET